MGKLFIAFVSNLSSLSSPTLSIIKLTIMPSAIEQHSENAAAKTDEEVGNFIQNVKHEGVEVVECIKTSLPDRKSNFMSEEEKDRIGLGHDISHYPSEKPYSICLREVPVTAERRPYFPKDGDKLIDAGTARSNIAASREAPNGTTQDNWAKDHAHETVSVATLQRLQCILTIMLDATATLRILGWRPRRHHLAL